MFDNNTPKYLSPPTSELPIPAEALRATWQGYDVEPEQGGVPLAHYLWILRRHRWKILSFVFACVGITLIVSTRLTPIFESTATVDVDRQMPTGIIGQESTRPMLNDSDQFLATQVKLIQSDSVLRPVAQKFHLVDAEKEASDTTPQRAIADEEDAPVLLKKLKVTRPPNTYLLLISYRSPDPRLAADVANGVTHSYLEHTYSTRYRSSAALSTFMEKQLEELKAKMERSSAALAQFEKELNVINPEEKTSILSARLLQLNTDYTTAQTERVRKETTWNSVRAGTLEAAQVSTQGEALHRLAERLDDAQQKFAEVKMHFGSNHPEYRKAAVQLAEVERQLQQGRDNAAQRVEVEYREAHNREAMLRLAVAETKTEFDRLNAHSFEYQALKREAEADKKMYEELIHKIREAGINAGFQNSSIRIADEARPALKPVFPNMTTNLLVAFLFSTLLAIGAAVLSDVLDTSVRNSEQVATLFKIDVIGSLPMVKQWRNRFVPAFGGATVPNGVVPMHERLERPTLRQFLRGGKLRLRWGGSTTPGSKNVGSGMSTWYGQSSNRSVAGFEEAVRTLRNSILLSTMSHRPRSIMVTSSAPSEGKTTTSVHLALAHAQQNHKTLLIDGDFRRPSVHTRLGLNPNLGLASALQNGFRWREKIINLEGVPNLDILPTGPSSRRAADLIGPRLPAILEQAGLEYDLIFIDAPPLLGFPEPLQMAAAVDAVLVVAHAGKTDRKAVGSVLNTLKRVHANVIGLVLNEVTQDMGETYGYYNKYYKYYKPS